MKLEKALELRKAKYLKRTGSPGHYKYIYKQAAGGKTSMKEAVAVREKKGKDEGRRKKQKDGAKISAVREYLDEALADADSKEVDKARDIIDKWEEGKKITPRDIEYVEDVLYESSHDMTGEGEKLYDKAISQLDNLTA